MCGISGQFNYLDPKPVEQAVLERMTKVQAHRGPDDEGYFLSGPIGLGFRRLSIIDLEGGRQPMSDQEEMTWVVFNGEIYNFPELRRELEGLGHRFRTKSDTEVILHGYRQWGLDVFRHLNGMFGLAIWDASRRRLVLARDPMGIKFVYYKRERSGMLFGSEIRAILAGVSEVPEIDPLAVNLFLRYRYTPSPLTLFRGICKLAPGTMMILENGAERIERWYTYRPVPSRSPISDNEARDRLLELYLAAVKRHLLSDVPLGLLLSGGIDSGLLLALMNRSGRGWRAYTVGYGESFRDDELEDAARTARLLNAVHVPVWIDRAAFEIALPKVIGLLEEPVATASIVPMYFVSGRAREDVKVALIGQGPDELFGGYRRHLGVHYGGYWRRTPEVIRRSVAGAVRGFPRSEMLMRGVHSLGVPDRMKRYQQVFSLLPGERIDGLFRDGILPEAAGDRVLEFWADLEALMERTDELGGLQFLEVRSSLPDELLMYADKLSMAHGLEVRVPYLDRTVVEYVETLPARLKIRHGIGKWLHRKVCGEFLPREVLNRKKRGFASNVVDGWFRETMSRHLDDRLLDGNSRMYGWLRRGEVQRLLSEHRTGKRDHHKILFSLVVLEEWLRSNRTFLASRT